MLLQKRELDRNRFRIVCDLNLSEEDLLVACAALVHFEGIGPLAVP